MRYSLSVITWLVTDLVVFVGSYALAYFWRVGFILSSDFPFSRFILVTLMVSPLWLAALVTTRTFALARSQTTLRNVAYITYANIVGNAFFALVYYFVYGAFFSRLLLIVAFILSTVLTLVWHVVFAQIQRRWLRSTPATFPTLVVGVTRESRALIHTLQTNKNPLVPVAVLDAVGVKDADIHGVPNMGKLNKLEETLEKYRITHLIQASDLEQSINLLSACRQRGITYMLLPSVMGMVERDERIETLEGQPVTQVSPKRGLFAALFS